MVGGDHASTGERVDATVGERGAHRREVVRRHEQRALARVDVGRLVGIEPQPFVAVHEVSDAVVAVVGGQLGFVHLLVDHQLATGERRQSRRAPRPTSPRSCRRG